MTGQSFIAFFFPPFSLHTHIYISIGRPGQREKERKKEKERKEKDKPIKKKANALCALAERKKEKKKQLKQKAKGEEMVDADDLEDVDELKAMVLNLLEKKGVLAQLRAKVRASVFEAVATSTLLVKEEEVGREKDDQQSRTNPNTCLSESLSTPEGRLFRFWLSLSQSHEEEGT